MSDMIPGITKIFKYLGRIKNPAFFDPVARVDRFLKPVNSEIQMLYFSTTISPQDCSDSCEIVPSGQVTDKSALAESPRPKSWVALSWEK